MGLHIMMLPWFAYGHLIPFMQLANKLAEKGHKITFLVPTKSKSKIKHLNHHPNLITFHSLTVPQVDGLPAGAETTSDVPGNLQPLIATAMDRTKDQVEELIYSTRPNVVFHDFSHWLTQITKPLHIKTVDFMVPCASLAAYTAEKYVKSSDSKFVLPPKGYPSKTVVLGPNEEDLKSLVYVPFGENISFHERLTTVREECDMFAMRTCREIEGQFCDYIAQKYNKPVFLTGPILDNESDDSLLEEKWANWLNGFENGSVVFCVFGSEHFLEKDQFQELLLGFELTGFPFLLALKPPIGASTVEEAFPMGFEERIKGRGLVSGEWVPQQAILKHPSVGCFVNHCGSASMWESLMSDCQVVFVPPNRGDFILQARLLANEVKAALEVEKEENGWVSKENMCKAVRCVMDEDDKKGDLIRKNHTKLKELLVSPGYMSGYIDRFVHELENFVQAGPVI